MMNVEERALAVPMSMAERWSMPSSVDGGGYLLIDPLTGERIDAERPPIWIEDNAVLAGGLAYLRNNAEHLSFTAFFIRHETAEDLGDPQKGWYEGQVQAADFYGYESLKQTRELLDDNKRTAHAIMDELLRKGLPPTPENLLRFAIGQRMSTFLVRVLAAVHFSGTPSFPVDTVLDGTTPERALDTALMPILEHPDRQLAGLAFLGFQNPREWIALARMGIQLRERFGELHAPLKGFVTFGAEHRDLQRKAKVQSVRTRAVRLASMTYDPREMCDMAGILASGVVLPSETPMLVELADDVRDYMRSLHEKISSS